MKQTPPHNSNRTNTNASTAAKSKRSSQNEFIVNPFTIIIDQREKAPFSFSGFRSDADKKNTPLIIPTRVEYLVTGDYTIEGFQSEISVERKSISDLVGTLTAGRERFIEELQRAQEMKFAAVVVEGGWSDVLQFCHEAASRNASRSPSPKTVFRSIVAFQQRFHRVHWWMCNDRRMAEWAAFRILDRYFRDRISNRANNAQGMSDEFVNTEAVNDETLSVASAS